MASGIPQSHEMPDDVQASQNAPRYEASISPTTPIMTSISAVQPVFVQRNVTSEPHFPTPVALQPAEKSEKNHQLAAMKIVKKQVGQQESITVAGIKISKAEVNDGMMDCVKRAAKALRVEAE